MAKRFKGVDSGAPFFETSPEVIQRHILGFLNGQELVLFQVTSMHFKSYLSGNSPGILNLWSAELIRLESLRHAKEVERLEKKLQNLQRHDTLGLWARLLLKAEKSTERDKLSSLTKLEENVAFYTHKWKSITMCCCIKNFNKKKKKKVPLSNNADMYLRLDYLSLFKQGP
jgi:hypothetical protein